MTTKRIVAIIIMIMTFSIKLNAQNNAIDSLKLKLKNTKEDTTRVQVYLELGTLIYQVNAQKAIDFWTQASKICQLHLVNSKATNSELKNRSFYLIGLATAMSNKGQIYDMQGDNINALLFDFKSLKLWEGLKDTLGMATCFNNIGLVYNNQGDILKALEYHHKSLKLSEAIEDKLAIANSLNNIGGIYLNQGDTHKALESFNMSLKINQEMKDDLGIANAFNSIGGVYQKFGDITKTLEYYQKSLSMYEQIGDKIGTAYGLNNIASIYDSKKDYVKSLEYYKKSLKIQEEINDQYGIGYTLRNIAQTMLDNGNTAEASAYALRCINIARELGYPSHIEYAALVLKNIYKKQNKFKEALEMYELEIQMRDSINNTETKKASIKKQFQYEYEKKAAADSVKNAEEQKVKNALLTAQQAQLKQEKTQRLALYGGLILVIAFSGFVFNRFRVTQKQKVVIEQQKTLVDEAFAQLEEKNKEVMDSIHYAKRIQTALMPNEKFIDRTLNKLNNY
jgi:tetratricopeptide (TPR) repeat protein